MEIFSSVDFNFGMYFGFAVCWICFGAREKPVSIFAFFRWLFTSFAQFSLFFISFFLSFYFWMLLAAKGLSALFSTFFYFFCVIWKHSSFSVLCSLCAIVYIEICKKTTKTKTKTKKPNLKLWFRCWFWENKTKFNFFNKRTNQKQKRTKKPQFQLTECNAVQK